MYCSGTPPGESLPVRRPISLHTAALPPDDRKRCRRPGEERAVRRIPDLAVGKRDPAAFADDSPRGGDRPRVDAFYETGVLVDRGDLLVIGKKRAERKCNRLVCKRHVDPALEPPGAVQHIRPDLHRETRAPVAVFAQFYPHQRKEWICIPSHPLQFFYVAHATTILAERFEAGRDKACRQFARRPWSARKNIGTNIFPDLHL